MSSCQLWRSEGVCNVIEPWGIILIYVRHLRFYLAVQRRWSVPNLVFCQYLTVIRVGVIALTESLGTSIFDPNSALYSVESRHPMSIDALCNMPPDIPGIDASSVILTGSSDGYVRAVQLFPTNLLGVVTDHGEWPVERIAVGEGRQQLSIGSNAAKGVGQSVHRRGDDDDDDDDENNHTHGPWWVGSVGHEEVLRMSNLEAFLRKNGKEESD